MRAAQILDLVDEDQRVAVRADAGPLLVVAGAGTGKSRTLTSRVAYRVATGQVRPDGALVVTHSARAAGELRERLASFGVPDLEHVATRTIHAAALRQLQYFWPLTGRTGAPALCPDRRVAMRRALASLGAPESLPGSVVAEMLAEVEWAKARALSPEGYEAAAGEAGRSCSVSAAHVAAGYRAYQRQLREAEQLDFSDVVALATTVALRPEAAAMLHRQYRFLCVDEYQDVDPAQQALLDAWTGPGRDVTVVGDPRQAIYGFKGAETGLIASFPSRFPDAHVVTLTRDYRSTPQIVEAANRLAAAGAGDVARRPRGKAAAAAWDAANPAPLVAARPAGPSVTARRLVDAGEEARWVARQVAATLGSGTPASEVAVLCRTNTGQAQAVAALSALGIDVDTGAGARLFERPEVSSVIDELERRWRDGSGEDVTGLTLLREVLADAGFDAAFEPTAAAARVPWSARRDLLASVEGAPHCEDLGCAEVVGMLRQRQAAMHDVAPRTVQVLTIHRAKGLEWDVVFSLGWARGTLPVFASDVGLAEERRLAYVAITRARHRLTLTFPARGERHPVQPSPFLSEAGLVAQEDGTSWVAAPAPKERSASRRPPAGEGSCRRCTRPITVPELVALQVCPLHLEGEPARRFAALKTWRGQVCALEALPPFRVLPDRTLIALAAAEQVDADSLTAVHGMGPSRVQRYGHELLALLAG